MCLSARERLEAGYLSSYSLSRFLFLFPTRFMVSQARAYRDTIVVLGACIDVTVILVT